MSFKSLPLNREKITEALQGFSTDAKVFGPQTKPNGLYIYTVKLPGMPEATLNVYHLKDGNTTLATNFGQNKDLSEKIATHVKDTCEYKDVSTKSVYLKRVENEEFNTLLDFLKDFGVVVESGKELHHGEQLKITGPYGDYLFLNKYTNGSLQIQGNSKILKSWVIEGLTELLPYKDIIEGQLKSLEVKVTTEQVINELEHILPNAYSYLGETLIAIISPAVSLKSVEIQLKDYSAFAFPALKGLEGYIKKMLKDKGVPVSKDGFGELFENSVAVKLNQETKNKIKSPKTEKAIENSYHYFKKHRHSLFHVDGNIETARIIETKTEAEEMVEDIFKIIEVSYSDIIAP